MTISQISIDDGLKPPAESPASFLEAIGCDAVSSSPWSRHPSALEDFLASEQQRLHSLLENRFTLAKRIFKTLGLHSLSYEVNIFVETDTRVLIGYLLHQAKMFMRRCMATHQEDLSPRVIATVASLQKHLQVKSHRLHQQPCHPTTTAKRAALLAEHLTPTSRVLCLGDDDFVSVALAMMVENEITVLDLDPQVLSLIQRIARDQQFRITTHAADIRRPLPGLLAAAFDVLVTDPIYHINEMLLFLAAAERCLRKTHGSAILSCCSRAMAGPAWQAVEAWGVSHGLVVAKCFEGFNEYPKPARIRNLLMLAERLLCRTPMTRACVAIPYAYSDLVVFQFRD